MSVLRLIQVIRSVEKIEKILNSQSCKDPPSLEASRWVFSLSTSHLGWNFFEWDSFLENKERISVSGLLFLKVTQPGMVTRASNPSIWEMGARWLVLPACPLPAPASCQHPSWLPALLPLLSSQLNSGCNLKTVPLTHTLRSYHVALPGILHCQRHTNFSSLGLGLSDPTKASPAILQTYAPIEWETDSLVFFPLSPRQKRSTVCSFPCLPFLISGTYAPLPWCPLGLLAEQFSVFAYLPTCAPGTAGWCCVMAASASSCFLLSAKFRPGLPPFQRMTLPYDPHSGNSNPQASLPHFYVLQSRGSHSCRVQTPVHLTDGLSFPSPPFDCPVHLMCFRATQDMHKVWKGGGHCYMEAKAKVGGARLWHSLCHLG